MAIEACCSARSRPGRRDQSGRRRRASRRPPERVGLAALFEFVFRVGIVGIAVGMKLQRQLAIGALDLLIGGGAGYAQHLVVVAFSVAGQNGLSQVLSG